MNIPGFFYFKQSELDYIFQRAVISKYVFPLILNLSLNAMMKHCQYNLKNQIINRLFDRFQTLVQKVHLTPSVSNPVHKRFLIDCKL